MAMEVKVAVIKRNILTFLLCFVRSLWFSDSPRVNDLEIQLQRVIAAVHSVPYPRHVIEQSISNRLCGYF